MKTVTLEEARDHLTDLAREVEAGETVTVVDEGRPLFDLVRHAETPKRKGLDLEAGYAFLRARGITNPVPYIAEDFDAQLPEDFLLQPQPKDCPAPHPARR